MQYVLGVDLGTTISAVATTDNQAARMVSLGHNSVTEPSVVYLTDEGTLLAGSVAEHQARSSPLRVAREFKRRFGDTTPLFLAGTPVSADQLMLTLFEHVVSTAAAQLGGAPESVVVTHPANWGDYKRALLYDTLSPSSPGELYLLAEPTAAAMHYARQERIPDGSSLAVYDLGGGTFDTAVLRKSAGGWEQLGPSGGIERLGGIDFDETVFRMLLGRLGLDPDRHDEFDDEDPAVLSAIATLRADAVLAKEQLSSATSATVVSVIPGHQAELRITRAEFEQLIRPALGRTIDVLGETTAAAADNATVDWVLLVGGSSRIPLVAEMISGQLGLRVSVDAHPKHAIALGAATSLLPHPVPGPAVAAAPPIAPEPEGSRGPDPVTTREAPLPPTRPNSQVAPPATEAVAAGQQGPPPADPAPGAPGMPPSPPGSADAGAVASEGKPNRAPYVVALAVLALLVLAGAFALVNALGGDGTTDVAGAGAGEVFLEPADRAGPNPYFDDVGDLVMGTPKPFTPAAVEPDTTSGVPTPTINGREPGLYGGSGDATTCDKELLVSFLTSDSAKGAAWADVHGITVADIPGFVEGLTSVQLLADTRVTNHGFRDGRPTSLQSILQAGSAVLVDDAGVPRVKCNCGNPLLPPIAQTVALTYSGSAWSGFEPAQVTVVGNADKVDTFVLRDVSTGLAVERPAGTDGELDRATGTPAPDPLADVGIDAVAAPVPATTVAPSTTSTTSEPTTTTEPLQEVDVTSRGTVSANTTFSGFPAALSVDGDPSTSWFSTGPGAGDSVYTWSGPPTAISTVVVLGNGGHATADFRTGFGFESLTVEVLDGGVVVFSSTVSMAGTPDEPPPVAVGGVVGDTVRLVLSGHEDPICGGFSELQIIGLE